MDRVIRREFEIVEGDAYNQLKIDRSVRNVRNLGYFRDVKVATLQGSSPEQTITRVTVEEQSTGDFSIGLGYSSLDKSSVSLALTNVISLALAAGPARLSQHRELKPISI